MGKEIKFLPALTGLRCILVYLIFFKHNNLFDFKTNPDCYLFLNQFYTFLNFFFVLSGFLICHKYFSISTLNKREIYNYFINRFSRVFPILIILTTITFAINYLHETNNFSHIFKLWLYNITLIKGFSQQYNLTGIGPSWSLSVEEIFYAICPLLFYFLNKKNVLFKFILSTYFLGFVITFMFKRLNNHGFFDEYLFTFYGTFFGRVFEFVCGIYLAMIYKGKYSNKFLVQLGGKTLYLGLLIISICLIGLFLVSKTLNLSHAIESWGGLFINNILMPIGITLFFYGLIFHESKIKNLLSKKNIR